MAFLAVGVSSVLLGGPFFFEGPASGVPAADSVTCFLAGGSFEDDDLALLLLHDLPVIKMCVMHIIYNNLYVILVIY